MKTGKLFYLTENGDRHLLGQMNFPSKENRSEIIKLLMDSYWDSRLDAASCSPVTQVDEEEWVETLETIIFNMHTGQRLSHEEQKIILEVIKKQETE